MNVTFFTDCFPRSTDLHLQFSMRVVFYCLLYGRDCPDLSFAKYYHFSNFDGSITAVAASSYMRRQDLTFFTPVHLSYDSSSYLCLSLF